MKIKFNLPGYREKFLLLDGEMKKKGFWNVKEDRDKMERWNLLNDTISSAEMIDGKLENLGTLVELLEQDEDADLAREGSSLVGEIEKDMGRLR